MSRIRLRTISFLILLLVLGLVAAACGSAGSDSTDDSGTATTVASSVPPKAPPATKPSSPDSGAVTSLEAVRDAVVRVEATGSYDYPDSGTAYNEGFVGSGFFISPDGLAVTNNHVVTGAAFLQVYVAGEDEPRNARVVGVSECSDLAVIDVVGDTPAYLDWRTGPPTTGLHVYAAGFPLGDEEYTLLDGIVSKEKADGESSWASVDSVIEHTADILPGNSGGPLVADDGTVVGVNYAGNDEDQAFAIGAAEALKVIPQLGDGQDVNSIGINGEAMLEDGASGVWVYSVASGSAADMAGVRPGDIITEIEGLIPGSDGTMSDYCDVLRGKSQGSPIQLEVWRASDNTFMEGTLNTDKVLVATGGGLDTTTTAAPTTTTVAPTTTTTPAPTTTTTAAPTTTTAAPPTTLVAPPTLRWNPYVGECLEKDQEWPFLMYQTYESVSCNLPHKSEVFYVALLSGESYPSTTVATIRDTCNDQFDAYVGAAYETSALDYYAVVPGPDEWDSDDQTHGVACVLYLISGDPLTSSAYQSGW